MLLKEERPEMTDLKKITEKEKYNILILTKIFKKVEWIPLLSLYLHF